MSGPAGAPQPLTPDPGLSASAAAQAAAAAMPTSPAPPAAPPSFVPGPASDPATWAPTAPAARACPWCSAALPDGEADRCASCGANLVYGSAQQLPGVTEVAPGVIRSRTAEPSRRGSRILSWISGETEDEPAPIAAEAVPLEALALPSRDVRLEMLRLRLTAEGMVINESGEIAPGPELQADMAAQAELAAQIEIAAQTEVAAAPTEIASTQAAAAPTQGAAPVESPAAVEQKSAPAPAGPAAPDSETQPAS